LKYSYTVSFSLKENCLTFDSYKNIISIFFILPSVSACVYTFFK